MVMHLTTLSSWVSGEGQPYLPAAAVPDGALLCIDEGAIVELANQDHLGSTEQLVALVLDEAPSGPPTGPRDVPGLIERDAVRAVRYLRRDPTGRYVSAEIRPPLAEALDLLPHPEGGWFRQTWATEVKVTPPGFDGSRVTATAIYFLLPPTAMSCWHQVRSDELWLWQRGGPLELRLGGSGNAPGDGPILTLGPDVEAGQVLQALVPGGTWQTARPSGGTEVLVSTVVSPGFDFADFRAAPDPPAG